MSQSFIKNSDFIQSFQKEGIKQHIEYDGSNRMTEVYEAMAYAEHGDHCTKTSYQYDGASNRVSGMKEEMSTWNSAWDF
jgi:hypothetical protein